MRNRFQLSAPWAATAARRALIGIGLAIALLSPLAGQAEGPEGARREKARTFLMVHLVEALKLNTDQAGKVGAVIRASDERRQQLVRQREASEVQLRDALDKHADESALLSLIATTRQLDQQIAAVPEEAFTELQGILSVEQQARFLLFRRELQGEVRSAMQRRLGGAHRAPGKGSHDTATPAAPR